MEKVVEKNFLGRKILLIDDSEELRLMMSYALKRSGYEVIEASSGKQALLKLPIGSLPNLIFLDCMMDEMDGRSFLNEVEHLYPEILSDIPIIMLTGSADIAALETRVSEVVAKPIGLVSLLNIVNRYIH